ncbi:MAG: hypothetical protein ACRD06_08410, partial [Terriglobia bacterium]
MRAFFVFKKRDLQPRFGQGDFLKLIEVFGLLQRAFVENRIRQGKKAAAGADFLGIRSRSKSFAGRHLSRNVSSKLV